MALIEISCFHCQALLSFSDRVGFREECSQCKNDVHVCKNCDFYDPSAYNECREPQAERSAEKDRSNRCEYFNGSKRGGGKSTKNDLMAQAEALFKKS